MTTRVTVTTGARLHFGPLCDARRGERRFGGIGLMVDSPACRVTVSRADRDEFLAPPEFADAVRNAASRLREERGIAETVSVRLESGIPRHAGLGSGTQTALAVGQAVNVLFSGEPADAESLARSLGRGKRSAVGIHGFQRGGFVIDAGKRAPDDVGTLAVRLDVPHAWRFVLITPGDRRGPAGEAETAAFAELPEMPTGVSGRLCRLALLRLLPALRAADQRGFAESLYEYGHTVGEYFAPVQGGVFADPGMARLAARLRREGIAGVAQSSWGPSIAVVLPDEPSARQLAADLQSRDWLEGCGIAITRPRNRPAEVACEEA